MGRRLREFLPWLLPVAVLFAVYGRGLWVWFHTDDFSLLWNVSIPEKDFWLRLFEPRAQGTYRPLSERLFFFYFHRWFGLDAMPYRELVFGTQIVNLWLFGGILRKIGVGRAAAVLAACLWAAHPGLSGTMGWSSAYNQALCSLFLLAALWGFLRFCETGRLGWYAFQWVAFLGGYSALEVIVVYPALATAYCLFFRRDRIAWAVPMFAGSAAIAWVQTGATPPGASPVYELSRSPVEWLKAAWFYARLSFGGIAPVWAPILAGGATLAFALWSSWRKDWRPLFGWTWAAITVSPYLPLGSHLSAYYLFIPAAGLALSVALAVVGAWRGGWKAALPTLALLAVYSYGTVRYSWDATSYNYRVSIRARNLVTGLRYARHDHPDKTILLTGVDDELYYASIYHDVFLIAEVFDVHLAPDVTDIRPMPGRRPIDRFILSPEQTLASLKRGSLVVYDASGLRLREVTSRYSAYAPIRLRVMSADRN